MVGMLVGVEVAGNQSIVAVGDGVGNRVGVNSNKGRGVAGVPQAVVKNNNVPTMKNTRCERCKNFLFRRANGSIYPNVIRALRDY